MSFILTACTTLGAFSQNSDTWKVMLNKDLICEGSIDGNTEKPAFLSKQLVKKSGGYLYISYKTMQPQEGWKRIFYINNEKDSVYNKSEIDMQSGKVCVPISLVLEMLNRNEKIVIHTVSIPLDPEKAAMVRVRRITLCTIGWKL